MRVCLTTVLPCSFEHAVAEVKSPRLLEFVAHPLVRFEPLQPPTFPSAWAEATYWVKLKLFGFLPLGTQAVVISYPQVATGFALRDAGYSSLIKTWDHWIFITKGKDGATHYRDEVRIEAGILTPFIWLFAQWFYRHRQRRWLSLALGGFAYGGV